MFSFDIYAVPRSVNGRLSFDDLQRVELVELSGLLGVRCIASEAGIPPWTLVNWRRLRRRGLLRRAVFFPVEIEGGSCR